MPASDRPVAGHHLALAWIRADPAAAAALAGIVATILIFYTLVPIFPTTDQRSGLTVFQWARAAWNPETHYEHGPLVPIIVLILIWNALPKLVGAAPRSSAAGLAPVCLGVLFYLLSARAIEPRIALAGLPLLLWGGVLYAAGWRFARALLFPIACLLFMIPVPGVDQATVRLQLLVANASSVICNAIGIPLAVIGTSVRAADSSFNFEIAGGCSGINSLMAITLMTAVFAHLSESVLWKQIFLFAASIPVAIIGNIARLVAIMIVAKCFGQEVAGGWFHEISAYLVSFPLALACLWAVHKMLNWPVSAPGVHPSNPGVPLTPSPANPYDY
jgi:exosortase